MKVRDIMTSGPRVCTPATNLGTAAHLMLEADCGILPVVTDGKLTGVVTDRDLFIALGTRNVPASQLTVGDVAHQELWTCEPEDDLRVAFDTMKAHCVRRLPVVGFGNTLLGIVSINDIVLAAGPRKAVRNDEVVDTLQRICAHHQPLVHVTAA
jgi:CBS domain-containing protein